MENLLQDKLDLLGFVDTSKNNEDTSTEPLLLFVGRHYPAEKISFASRLILEEAAKLSATAVYVRRNTLNDTITPQLLIYDNTHDVLTNDDIAERHRKIWSSDFVSVYYVFDRTQLHVYDARKPVQRRGKRIFARHETINLVADAHEQYQKYSAQLFDNGSFWELPEHSNKFLHGNSAAKKLITAMERFRDNFVKQYPKHKSIIDKILVQSILVKYLEERRDGKNNRVFKKDFFGRFNNATNFCDVIRNGQIIPLFQTLSQHFNGKIFELKPDEIEAVQSIDLSELADFLDARLDNNQYAIWRLYAFDYLPVELISHIYEVFVPKKDDTKRDDVVYTPLHLARFMVDECMPIESPQDSPKIIDISCGSGIFLVTAFKRLVQWWQKKQYEQTGQLVSPNVQVLKTILSDSIYGIDIESPSIRLTFFSLSIALCDMLSPIEIWADLKFDDLEETNLYTGDFFEFLQPFLKEEDKKQEDKPKFDLVIGNPPFGGSDKIFDETIEKYEMKVEYKIPNKQIALLFLQQAMNILRPDGLLCLVMPSGPLLYNSDAFEYRKQFFTRHEVPQIADFSMLDKKNHLFRRAVATAVIFARKKAPNADHHILHITIKRTKIAREKRFFEIDHYDLHYVPLNIAVSESDLMVWKANLFGGGHLYYLLKRLQTQTLKTYLDAKVKNNGWFCGEGYIVGKEESRKKAGEKAKEKAKYKDNGPHITGYPSVDTEQFTEESGIAQITIERNTDFYRKSNKKLFEPPHLLIKESPGKRRFITAYCEDYLTFKHEIIGIHAPWEEKDELIQIETYLQENYLLLKALMLSSSSRAGISRSSSTVLKKDFMSLPYPEDMSILELSPQEEIVVQDLLEYGLEELNKGETALVNTQQVNDEQLQQFGEVFLDMLNPIYRVGQYQFHALEPIQNTSYICYPFYYGAQDDILTVSKELSDKLGVLVNNERGTVVYTRVLFDYTHQDIVCLIKPKTVRYWLRSIALRDVATVIRKLVASGY